MFIALSSESKRVHISKTHISESYFCPICGEELILKKGQERAHHFAHKSGSHCADSWHYDKSDWHFRWQSMFPEVSQEVVFEFEGEKHRADVFLKDSKTVIEFQHSSLSSEDFRARNRFYTSLGFSVIWVFDFAEEYENGGIDELEGKNNRYKWVRPKKTFDVFDCKDSSVALFFQIENNPEANEHFQELKETFESNGFLLEEERTYYKYHKDDVGLVIRITWSAPSGFERFAAKSPITEEDFLRMFLGERVSDTKKTTFTVEDLYDIILSYRNERKDIVYYGCPLYETGCVPFETCMGCPHSLGQCGEREQYAWKCKARYEGLITRKLDNLIIERNWQGRIRFIEYDDGGKRMHLDIPQIRDIGTDLRTIWDGYRPKVIRCYNIRTQYEVQLTKRPNLFGKVYGKIKKPGDDYSKNPREIYGPDKKEWLPIWVHK